MALSVAGSMGVVAACHMSALMHLPQPAGAVLDADTVDASGHPYQYLKTAMVPQVVPEPRTAWGHLRSRTS